MTVIVLPESAWSLTENRGPVDVSAFTSNVEERIVAYPAASSGDVTASQAWFWKPEWQAGEREADQDLAAGRSVVFSSIEEMDAYLARIPLPNSEPGHN